MRIEISRQPLDKYEDRDGDHACPIHINGEVTTSLMAITT